jgi:hypothetical protein
MLHIELHIIPAHKVVFKKIDLYLAYVKKDKK